MPKETFDEYRVRMMSEAWAKLGDEMSNVTGKDVKKVLDEIKGRKNAKS